MYDIVFFKVSLFNCLIISWIDYYEEVLAEDGCVEEYLAYDCSRYVMIRMIYCQFHPIFPYL